MPTYKNLPKNKKNNNRLPLYRPLDRYLLPIWKNRTKLLPYLIGILSLLLIYGGSLVYFSHYNDTASNLYSNGAYEKVIEDYGRSKAAGFARLKLGDKALQEEKYSEAVNWYRPLTESRGGLFRINAAQNMAYALIKEKKFEEATQLLDKIIEDPRNLSPDYSRLLLARTFEMKGEKEKGDEIYKSLSEGTENFTIQRIAKEKLSPPEEKKELKKEKKSNKKSKKGKK